MSVTAGKSSLIVFSEGRRSNREVLWLVGARCDMNTLYRGTGWLNAHVDLGIGDDDVDQMFLFYQSVLSYLKL